MAASAMSSEVFFETGPDRGPYDREEEHDDQGQAREALPIPDGVLGRLS